MHAKLDTFWIVMADRMQLTAQVRHQSIESAKREAERLATQVPGTRFFVMQVIGAAEVVRPVVWMAADDLPF